MLARAIPAKWRSTFSRCYRGRGPKAAFESPLSSEARRNVVWVKPERVAEVEFRGWTADANVRQASFKGLREDKNPKDIVRERVAPMAREAEAPATSVTFTHRDRVYWPEAGVTKQGLADYYTMVWPWIEKYLLGRPLVLLRCPNGIVQGGFFQKHPWAGLDPHILQIHDPHEKEPILGIEFIRRADGIGASGCTRNPSLGRAQRRPRSS